jgi:hypothetical protein
VAVHNHEKKISPRSHEIIRWESPRSHECYCVRDRLLSATMEIFSKPNAFRTVNVMNGYFVYNSEHRVLICKQHQYCVSRSSVPRHLLQEHDISITVRQEIISYVEQFATAEEITYSADKVIPIPYLRTITGFQCQYDTCHKILGTLQSVKKHCRLEHAWKAKDGECWVETRAQTFYQGNNQRYGFIV